MPTANKRSAAAIDVNGRIIYVFCPFSFFCRVATKPNHINAHRRENASRQQPSS
ncbi:hypothetical protein HRTV-25_gp60 [Halorubrum tailed virus 25]|uniref:Uncharacterized protein n=1 Tax=Halorubrum tailed virus 25 TaxID=2878006 RepID=A0AAE8XZQ7_9CAUD|nr:hypothetical protein M1M37_gp060 [Halorubrum tailed virus 25]UBF22641.1 hypothetical protein HRTV-25_gp60 [Halorubrum tailed virus 25]